MAFEQKPGQFALFKNEKKGDTSPDYRGDGLDLNGIAISVSAWIKPMKSGGKFMSCNIRPKVEYHPKPESTIDTSGRMGGIPEMDDDLPF